MKICSNNANHQQLKSKTQDINFGLNPKRASQSPIFNTGLIYRDNDKGLVHKFIGYLKGEHLIINPTKKVRPTNEFVHFVNNDNKLDAQAFHNDKIKPGFYNFFNPDNKCD